MTTFLKKYATALIFWFFAISGITGILMFFHIEPFGIKLIHEWLGWVLVGAFVLHIARNWRPFLTYFQKLPIYVALVVAFVASGIVLAFTGGDTGRPGGPIGPGGPPDMAAFSVAAAVTALPLQQIAGLTGSSLDDLIAKIEAQGFVVSSPETTLDQITEGGQTSAASLLQQLLGQTENSA